MRQLQFWTLACACWLACSSAVAAQPLPRLDFQQPVVQPLKTVSAPMLALQVMLETYAMEHLGRYPDSLEALLR